MNKQKIIDKSPAGATHYSDWRKTYYKLKGDDLYELDYQNNWVPSSAGVNLSKWISLSDNTVDPEWNDGYWVEGLDRVHTILVMFEELLGEDTRGFHPAIKKAHLEKKVSKIGTKLAKLYQDLGAQIPD